MILFIKGNWYTFIILSSRIHELSGRGVIFDGFWITTPADTQLLSCKIISFNRILYDMEFNTLPLRNDLGLFRFAAVDNFVIAEYKVLFDYKVSIKFSFPNKVCIGYLLHSYFAYYFELNIQLIRLNNLLPDPVILVYL